MQHNFEHIRVEFQEKSRRIFFNALREFQYSTKKLDRNALEYKFNDLKDQHVHSLKLQLEEAAKNFIEFHQYHRQLREINQMMQQVIREHLHQFVVQSRVS
jgi:hypothetical protein